MPSPFPGMDPWLEHPALFPNLHQRLITYACDALQRGVGDRYFVSIGERVYIEEPEPRSFYPDVHIVERRHGRDAQLAAEADEPRVLLLEPIERREVYLELQDVTTGGTVVTVIEVLSPSNKQTGRGRELYLQKQANVLESTASLVEIDLLRAGEPTVAIPPGSLGAKPYRVVVSPARNRRRREIYAVGMRERLPRVAVPLRERDEPAVLDLQSVLAEAYDKGALHLKIDYTTPPVPPLPAADEAWASEQLAAAQAAHGSPRPDA